MCNLYACETNADAIRALTRSLARLASNLEPLPGIYPDMEAPIVRPAGNGLKLVTARWGMPSPAFALEGKKTDRGVTNIRNTASPHWRRWLSPAHRCVVPWTAFSEMARQADGAFAPVWFAADDTRPLRFFAGIWTGWTGVRKLKERVVTTDLLGFLTTEPNDVVRPVHPKAMPVVLETVEEIACWLRAEWSEARVLQRPVYLFLKALKLVYNRER